ncbi:MAG: thioesterase family protein [Deferrisomatales bacterium]|nr:thioesterase family protein [Deferrisomatales bacterium]
MEEFRFTHPYRVAIADINYGGHVSNAAVLEYFQEARIAYLAALGEFSELDIGDGCGMILVEARVRYRAEMFHGDALVLGVRTEAFGRTSFRLGYRIEGPRGVTAEGETTQAAFDYVQRKLLRVPQRLRDAATHFEGRSLAEPQP